MKASAHATYPMNILFICFNLSVLGGVQIHNKAFFEALKAGGNTVKLVELRTSSFFGKLSFIARACAAIIFYQPRLIITGHVNFSPLCLAAKQLFGTEYAVIVHGIDVWGLKSRLKAAAVRNADAVISVSRYTADRVREDISGLKGNIIVIPNVVDTERFAVRERQGNLIARHNLEGKKVILTVARLSAEEGYKGYDKVIEALPAILKKIPDAHYLIVGDGSDKERIVSLIRTTHVEGHVTLAGRVSDELLPDYYNLAHVFAMPSRGEGFGIVFIESAACGVPVVAGNRDGSVDAALHGELGLLVDPDSTEGIAAAIASILGGTADKKFYDRTALHRTTEAAFGIASFRKKIAAMLAEFATTDNS